MRTLVVIMSIAASMLLGCTRAETVSTDTAVTDTVAPEDAEVGVSEPAAAETAEAPNPTTGTEDSTEASSTKN